MSNIGRKAIDIGSVSVEIKGNEVHYKGPKATGIYIVPEELEVTLSDKNLKLVPRLVSRDASRLWGLHRALLSNALGGAANEFQKQLKIVGLGYKAVLQGKNIQFSLGFSHKIDVALPEGVSLEVDRPGQLLTFKSTDKVALGQICSYVRSLKPPEPYKGTGIQYVGEHIIKKAGKTKSA